MDAWLIFRFLFLFFLYSPDLAQGFDHAHKAWDGLPIDYDWTLNDAK